jgi:hypothetical protein
VSRLADQSELEDLIAETAPTTVEGALAIAAMIAAVRRNAN